MPTPTAEKLKIYFPGKYLTTDGDNLNPFTANSGDKREIVCNALTQADGYFDGALGWFDGDTLTPELGGIFFHVREFTHSTGTLLLSRDLPMIPQDGDTFRLVIGGKVRSSQETFGMKVGGVLPELSPVECVNITGVTIKKAAGRLGEGDLTITYNSSMQELFIKMDSFPNGTGLDVSSDLTDIPVYAEDDQGYILVDVDSANLPLDDKTDLFTLVYAKAAFTPDYEGYETAQDSGGKIRYFMDILGDGNPHCTKKP